jgi:hypothetical protein
MRTTSLGDSGTAFVAGRSTVSPHPSGDSHTLCDLVLDPWHRVTSALDTMGEPTEVAEVAEEVAAWR